MSVYVIEPGNLGRQGVYVCDNYAEKELKKYVNYLIQAVQTECVDGQLRDIAINMFFRIKEINKRSSL